MPVTIIEFYGNAAVTRTLHGDITPQRVVAEREDAKHRVRQLDTTEKVKQIEREDEDGI